jgi:hypothetical protein
MVDVIATDSLSTSRDDAGAIDIRSRSVDIGMSIWIPQELSERYSDYFNHWQCGRSSSHINGSQSTVVSN